MASDPSKFYELYRRSSLGTSLTDTLDTLITERRIEPQLAMKVLTKFDQAVAEILADKVKARLSFKGHLDTYRFCDEVWTFIIKDITFKLDNTNSITADKVKIVSCNTKRPATPEPIGDPNKNKKNGLGHRRVASDGALQVASNNNGIPWWPQD